MVEMKSFLSLSASLMTFAVDEGDHWKLNGSKIFITNAGFADVFIIIAVTGFVTDKRGRKQKEISAFIVERTDPGFKVGKPEGRRSEDLK